MNLLDVSFVFFIMLRAIRAQFLEQPGPCALFVPVRDQVTLTCAVEEGYIIDWRIDLVDGAEAVYASDRIVLEDLLQRGFTLEGVTSNESTLLLREADNQTNNGTNITCVARQTGSLAVPVLGENAVTVIFYDAPPPPTDLNVTENELGSVNISWSLEFIEGVPVNYTLTVLNQNTTSSDSITEILNEYFIFGTDRPCDVYSFTVTAVTAAGNSTPSQEIIFTRNNQSCINTTITEKRSAATSLNQLTFTSVPPVLKDNTTSPTIQDNSMVTLITIVSIVMIMVIAVLVVVNVIVCACCHQKKKQVPSDDIVEPVYETPGDAVHAKDVNQPFAMTKSSAYDVSKNFMTLAQKKSPQDIIHHFD